MNEAKYYFEDTIGDVFFLRVQDDSSYGGDPSRGKLAEIVFFRKFKFTIGLNVSVNPK